jgi:UBX domain-containing protein 1
VQPHQQVDVQVEHRSGEDYVPPPPQVRPFGGSGNRLGSADGAPAPAPAVSAALAPAASSSALEVDAAKPATNVQVRLAGGSK